MTNRARAPEPPTADGAASAAPDANAAQAPPHVHAARAGAALAGDATPAAEQVAQLSHRIAELAHDDARRLGRRLAKVRRMTGGVQRRELGALAGRVAKAEDRLAVRRSAVPQITYPPALPVTDHVDELRRAISEHQVVIVAGETGSGKSTQLPKICLDLGRGVKGLIGHTQPRRIAARTLAERVAEETQTMVGGAVGYAIRFGDVTSPRTLVKLMTDGILLAEIASDPDLYRYDTIIIDEAHERSLNIDFLLGYLKRLLPRRPDLKVIVTSATIDPERFAAHFGGAPIVEVSGRTFPVEIRYRPYGLDESIDDADPADEEFGAEDRPDGDDFSKTSHVSSSGQVTSRYDDPSGVRSGRSGGADTRSGGGRSARGARRVIAQSDAGRSGAADGDDVLDQTGAILQAVDELLPLGTGDILVFLAGEREITDTADALRARLQNRGGHARSIDVLPLFGRLSMADQHRVFAPGGRRRIVLATNVAETSLTVPGIRYVIDPGTARISRYSSRTKVQRLPIEKISQASANQRSGRCGRVADGICIRLYAQEDYDARDEFTDPEIARTSLASVILKMAALGLGDIAKFPFLDPPDPKQITDGITVLTELGALDRSQAGALRAEEGASRNNAGASRGAVRLTEIGRKLAELPVDPRLARILVEADKRRCLKEVLIIVSALAIRDVREYPLEDREKATAFHSRFADPTSDFAAYVSLWQYVRRQSKALSGNKFRKLCKSEYLHYLRIREWIDLHAQLSSAAGSLGMEIDGSVLLDNRAGGGAETGGGNSGPVRGSEAASVDHEAIHTALAAGLLSHIGARIEREPRRSAAPEKGRKPMREYQGTRGTTFAIWPGSVLAKAGAPLVLAAELVETGRLWARTVAAISPDWVERVGGDLIKRQYSEPHWSSKRHAAMATEKVMLLGVTLIASRPVSYAKIDPEHARELLIRHGLVEGDIAPPLPFLDANRAVLDEVAESERRARRRDIVIDDDALAALYEARIPRHIATGRALEAWWRKAPAEERAALAFSPEMVIAAGAELARAEEYPDQLAAGDLRLDLDYVFEPGAADDGVSATVPLAALASIDPSSLPAQVPGLRRELALALIKSLPKQQRRAFVPAPDFADAALSRVGANPGALPERLAEALTALAGIVVTPADFDYSKVPDHLRMRFTVVDDRGRTVATGDDLAAIQRSLAADTRKAVAKVSSTLERSGLTAFPESGLPKTTSGQASGQTVTGYPALVDEGESVAIRVFTDAADQQRAMRGGTRRLVSLTLAKDIAGLASRVKNIAAPRGPVAPGAKPPLTPKDMLRLSISPDGSLPALVADAADAAIDALLDWAGGPAWDQSAFTSLAARIRGQLERAVIDILAAAVSVLAAGAEADEAIATLERGAMATVGRRAPATATAGGSAAGTATRTAGGPTAGYVAGSLAAELRRERDQWLRPGFLAAIGARHLPDAARYLTALATRAERAQANPERDRERAGEVAALDADLAARVAELRPERRADDDVTAVRRLLAEYRIALFAQPMRTAVPVSAKRIRAAIAALPD